jgi:hypothetical protein
MISLCSQIYNSIVRCKALKGLILASVVVTPSHASADSKEWRFEVFLDDSKIGQHSFRTKQQGNERVIESEADFNVKFLFFNAYRYDHRNVETWEGDCLTSIDSSTDDNGESYTVNGERRGQRFVLETHQERKVLPGCLMTFAYWNPEILDESRLLNSQTGEYLPVRTRELGEDSLKISGQTVQAERYRIEANGLSIDLWYSKQGEWLSLQSMTESGKTISYRLSGDRSLIGQHEPGPGGAS